MPCCAANGDPAGVPRGLRFLNSPPHLGMGVERSGWRRMAPVGGRGGGRGEEGRRGGQTRRLDGGFHSGASHSCSFSSGRRRRRRRLRQRRRQRRQGGSDSTFKMAPAAGPVTSPGAEPPGWAGGAGQGCGGAEGEGQGERPGGLLAPPRPARPARCVPAGPARAFLVPGCSPHSAPTMPYQSEVLRFSCPPSRQCLHSGAGSVVS